MLINKTFRGSCNLTKAVTQYTLRYLKYKVFVSDDAMDFSCKIITSSLFPQRSPR